MKLSLPNSFSVGVQCMGVVKDEVEESRSIDFNFFLKTHISVLAPGYKCIGATDQEGR